MSLLASINFGIYLVLSPSHAYSKFLLVSIYFGEIILCSKFTKINGKPIFQALQYFKHFWITTVRKQISHSICSICSLIHNTWSNKPCGAKRKRSAELWTAVSGLLALISRAYPTPLSTRHQELYRLCMTQTLVVLMIFITTRPGHSGMRWSVIPACAVQSLNSSPLTLVRDQYTSWILLLLYVYCMAGNFPWLIFMVSVPSLKVFLWIFVHRARPLSLMGNPGMFFFYRMVYFHDTICKKFHWREFPVLWHSLCVCIPCQGGVTREEKPFVFWGFSDIWEIYLQTFLLGQVYVGVSRHLSLQNSAELSFSKAFCCMV